MNSKAVIEKDEVDDIVVQFIPQKFPMRLTESALHFHKSQSGVSRNDFHIDPKLAKTTGIGDLERMSIEEKVEIQALSKLKDMQEEAYKAAYQLGMDDGKKSGLEEFRADMTLKLESLDALLVKIENLKSELVAQNESFIIHLIHNMVSRLVMDEIKERPELILPVIKQVVESAQTDEKILIKLSPADKKFLQESHAQLGKDFDFLKNAKIEEVPDMAPGGCRIETNYGAINASLDVRLQKLWEALSQKMPRVKDQIGD